MNETEPQTAGGKVLMHFMMSLDGFVAGPGHTMDFMTGTTVRPGLIDEYIEATDRFGTWAPSRWATVMFAPARSR